MPDKSLFYESFAQEWDSQMNQDELGKRLRLIFGKLITPADARGKRVLDAGAGTGRFSRVLAEWGARLISLDLGPQLMAQVRAKAVTRTVCGSVLELPFRDSSFDLVLCTEVIEHTTDPRRAVLELGRVLSPGGTLVLTVPNRLWKPAVLIANALRVRPYMGYENWVGYSELNAWSKEAGLILEAQSGFNLLPHTIFCKPAFEFIDRMTLLHPYMINIAVRARKAARPS